LYRYDVGVQIEPLDPGPDLEIGAQAVYQVMLSNPLSQDVLLNLQPVTSGMTLVDLPKSVRVPARETVTIAVRSSVASQNPVDIQVTPSACETMGETF
jgi:hypothetical protein